MSRFAAFYETRNLFISTIGYKEPLSYEEWTKKPDDLKAAFLFVQFFNEILLAWDKADSLDFGDDSEGVSTILQYLEKQVSTMKYFRKDDPTKKATAEFRRQHPDEYIAKEQRMLEDDPKRFTPQYIYRVAYNCLYCICGHDRQRDKDIINNEVSLIVESDGEELNLLDIYADSTTSTDFVSEESEFNNEFWAIVEGAGMSAEKVMRYLLSGDKSDLRALTHRSKHYKDDPLRDVEVSIEDVDRIIEDLKSRFLELSANSYCGQYVAKMASMPI